MFYMLIECYHFIRSCEKDRKMSVAERIRICRLLELMDGQKKFCKEIGMKDSSRFAANKVKKEKKDIFPGEWNRTI